MKRIATFLLLFVSAYSLSLVVLAPAGFIANEIEKRYPNVELYGVEGSLWSGELRALKVEGNTLENLSWELSPFALLLGNAKLQLDSVSSQMQLNGTVTVGLLNHSIALSEMQLRFPLASYAQQLGIGGFDLQGLLELQLSQLDYEEGVVSGLTGHLVWRQAAIGEALSLGDLQVELSQEEGALEAVLSDQQGPISVNGELVLQDSGMYQLNTTMSARDASDINLKQALRLFGRTIGDNKFQAQKQGRIPLPAWFKLQAAPEAS